MIVNPFTTADGVDLVHIVSEMANRADIREQVNTVNPNAVLPECWPSETAHSPLAHCMSHAACAAISQSREQFPDSLREKFHLLERVINEASSEIRRIEAK